MACEYIRVRKVVYRVTTSENVPSARLMRIQISMHICSQGSVVQSIVSLTSSLRVISLTVLGDSIYNILIFFAEKM